MSKRSPASLKVKLHVVRLCLEHKSNPNYEAKQLGLSSHTVREWIRKYKADGLDGLKESKTWNTYSKELKIAAVNEVLSGHSSVEEAINKHHISSRSVLKKWISKYTNEIELKPTHNGNFAKKLAEIKRRNTR